MPGAETQGEPKERGFYVHVTDADVHAARDAWRRADALDPSSARTAFLYESLRQIVHAQAQQIANKFRAARTH